ncbi:MAG: sulfotransferase domain-containing protein [Pirellulales bacterium]
MHSLREGLSSRNGFVRKGARALLAIPKWIESHRAGSDSLAARPPVLANSFPKSGTHLLVQIIEGLPGRVNYGAFLGSEISSFQLRERSSDSTRRFIRGFVPGEIIRGHLYYEPQYAEELAARHAVHYFIYRDPRDVVVSEAHYLRDMNRWHRLHPYFRKAASIEDAIMLSINGLEPPVGRINYPNIAARFASYSGWLERNDCLSIRFEDLVSERQPELVRQIAEFYAPRTGTPFDVDAAVQTMSTLIAPQKSHTFRSGKKAGWQREFTPAHRERFAELAGDLLVRLGYEPDLAWASAPLACN